LSYLLIDRSTKDIPGKGRTGAPKEVSGWQWIYLDTKIERERDGTVTIPIWQWDETIQRGVDYASIAEVRRYDERMAAFRDVSAKAQGILTRLALSPDDVLLEIGTGTGAFARAAARQCRKVIAIDVSPHMLAYAAQRARDEQVENIDFREAGFLTYEHQDEPLAAVVSQTALHHLPDAWKLIALRRLGGSMRDGGRLYLSDVVFPDRAHIDWSTFFQRVVDHAGGDGREETATHIREEFSTFDWMMREILEHAGFEIEWAELRDEFIGHYLCSLA
jgi:putative AdoMet-dependent methyltransferase